MKKNNKRVTFDILIGSLLIALIYSSCCSTKPQNELALNYLFCTHCSINEENFKSLKDPNVIKKYNGSSLTEEEYSLVVQYADYQYDRYFRPYMDNNNLTYFNSIKGTTKKQYIEEKLAIYKNLRKEKVELWQKNLNNNIIVSRDSILKLHTPYYNYSDSNPHFSYIEKVNPSEKFDGYCAVKVKNRMGYVSDNIYYMNNIDCEYMSSENKVEKLYPLIFTEKKVGNKTFRLINKLNR